MNSFLEIFNWKKGECASAEHLWRTTVHHLIIPLDREVLGTLLRLEADVVRDLRNAASCCACDVQN